MPTNNFSAPEQECQKQPEQQKTKHMYSVLPGYWRDLPRILKHFWYSGVAQLFTLSCTLVPRVLLVYDAHTVKTSRVGAPKYARTLPSSERLLKVLSSPPKTQSETPKSSSPNSQARDSQENNENTSR